MEQVTLRAEPGRATGSRVARRLRREGKVPAVVYGRGLEATSVAIDQRDLYAALHTEAGVNALINLEVGDGAYLTVAREIQLHPVRGDVVHLDFVQISLTETITAEVGVEFEGVPYGVREQGGIVETVRSVVEIEALPTDIPDEIVINIQQLEVGDSVKLGDLPDLAGVTYLDDPDSTIATVVVPRAVVEEVEEEEELELVEGEELEEGEVPEEAAEAEEGAPASPGADREQG
ncbi:MAG: 50S ribosomal protein L25 [Acidimicrobiia bacterium]